MKRIPAHGACLKCGPGTRVQFQRVAGSSGWRVTLWCVGHDGLADPARAWWPASLFDIDTLSPRQSWLDRETTTCKVCGAIGPVEVHHLAPREMFGDSADMWPTVEVCRACHEEWHARMGHSIGHHSPVAP